VTNEKSIVSSSNLFGDLVIEVHSFIETWHDVQEGHCTIAN